ncbi:L-cystine transport system permease protein [Treponema bryantii]|uniref:L-cystine transport system permease protein n=1 Tax=Treponema bryantii TaxID=163 RepID=A0A1I3JR98_9SPIR|nr:amino acid ABC transporter permease [Treponema bryantii]SFI62455.1 L-cystine transport system permease protein [Treponema bryantii]
MQLDFSYLIKTFWLCVKAIPVTLEITIVSLLLAVIPALLIALARIHKVRVLDVICRIFVSFIRGTPIVLQILIVYSIMPSLLNSLVKSAGWAINVFEMNPVIYAFVVFGINSSATLSEVFRSAISSVDRGQLEAALSIGETRFQAFHRVVFPQAVVSALPNLCSTTVILIKNTSLAFMMTVREITAVAKIEAAYGYNYVESYIDIFVIYIVVCLAVEFIFRKIEKRVVYKGIKNYRNFGRVRGC